MSQDKSDIELYDIGIYEYLSTVCDLVTYSSAENAINSITRNISYADNIPLSFISFYRLSEFEIDTNRYNFTASTTGDFVRLTIDNVNGTREARYVKNIPVNLNYQIDLWSAKMKTVQELAIRLISKIYMQNQIILANMNPDMEPARFHIVDVSWSDNSDIETSDDVGKQIYRHTIVIKIDARIKLVEDIQTTPFICCKELDIDIYE